MMMWSDTSGDVPGCARVTGDDVKGWPRHRSPGIHVDGAGSDVDVQMISKPKEV